MAKPGFGSHRTMEDPAIVRRLLSDTRWSWIWAILRIWLGYQWINAGLHKISDPGWVQTGASLKGFWTNIIVVPAKGKPVITYDWYRNFIASMLESGSYTWFAKVVAYGELILGILLVLGLFTGFMAFLAAFANMNFMLAGSSSTNPILFTVAILLLLAWKVAGHWGLDYFVLPMLGTPWRSEGKAETST